MYIQEKQIFQRLVVGDLMSNSHSHICLSCGHSADSHFHDDEEKVIVCCDCEKECEADSYIRDILKVEQNPSDEDYMAEAMKMIAQSKQMRAEQMTDKVGNITIDTVNTLDHGWETAIDKGDGNWILVQRYVDAGAAKLGHLTWIDVIAENPNMELENVVEQNPRQCGVCGRPLTIRTQARGVCGKCQRALFGGPEQNPHQDMRCEECGNKIGCHSKVFKTKIGFSNRISNVCRNCYIRINRPEVYIQSLPEQNPLTYHDYKEAIEGEGWAIGDYADMIVKADTTTERETLLHIRKEEQEHFDELMDLWGRKHPEYQNNPGIADYELLDPAEVRYGMVVGAVMSTEHPVRSTRINDLKRTINLLQKHGIDVLVMSLVGRNKGIAVIREQKDRAQVIIEEQWRRDMERVDRVTQEMVQQVKSQSVESQKQDKPVSGSRFDILDKPWYQNNSRRYESNMNRYYESKEQAEKFIEEMKAKGFYIQHFELTDHPLYGHKWWVEYRLPTGR